MKVGIDLTPAIRSQAGIGRYAEELAGALLALHADLDLRVFCVDDRRRSPRPPLDALARTALPWNARLWRAGVAAGTWLGLSFDSMVGEVDLFHATDHLLPPLGRVKSVFTLHDLTSERFPKMLGRGNRAYSRAMLHTFARRADALIAVSEATKKEAVEVWGLAPQRIHAIPVGVGEPFRPPAKEDIEAVRSRYGLPPRYFLFVGTIEPRKNVEALYLALAAMRSTAAGLVVVGRRGWLCENSFRILAQSGVAHRVIFPGPVSDRELPAFYGGAEAFLFPSWYEGFGSPLLEAMACGAPVVASDRSSPPEVVGDAGILLPPDDPSRWAAALDELLENPHWRRDLIAKGRARAAEFTWERAARATLEVYRGVCDGRS